MDTNICFPELLWEFQDGCDRRFVFFTENSSEFSGCMLRANMLIIELYASNWVAAMWLADRLFVLPGDWTGVPIKVAGECIFICIYSSYKYRLFALRLLARLCYENLFE